MRMGPSAAPSATFRRGANAKGGNLVTTENVPRAKGAARQTVGTKVNDAIANGRNSSSSSSGSSSSSSSSGSSTEETPHPQVTTFSTFRGVSESERNGNNSHSILPHTPDDPRARAASQQLPYSPVSSAASPRQRGPVSVPFNQQQQQQQQERRRQQHHHNHNHQQQQQQSYSDMESRVQSLEEMLLHMSALNRELEFELFETRRELVLCKQSARDPPQTLRRLSNRPSHNPMYLQQQQQQQQQQRSARRERLSRVVSLSHPFPSPEEVLETPESLRQPRGIRSQPPHRRYQPERVPVSGRMREQTQNRQRAAPSRVATGTAQRGRSVSAPRPVETRRNVPRRSSAGAQCRPGPASARQARAAESSPAVGPAAVRRASPDQGKGELAELQRRYWEQSREVLEQLDRMLADE